MRQAGKPNGRKGGKCDALQREARVARIAFSEGGGNKPV